MKIVTDPIRLVSPTFRRQTLDRILTDARPFTDTGHFLYPADEDGNHTKGFFAFERVARTPTFVDSIADDIAKWEDRTSIDVDVVFAPAQPAVRPLAEAVGARLERPTAYWEYLPSGRYGSRLAPLRRPSSIAAPRPAGPQPPARSARVGAPLTSVAGRASARSVRAACAERSPRALADR